MGNLTSNFAKYEREVIYGEDTASLPTASARGRRSDTFVVKMTASAGQK
jgi:hypothetical protein